MVSIRTTLAFDLCDSELKRRWWTTYTEVCSWIIPGRLNPERDCYVMAPFKGVLSSMLESHVPYIIVLYRPPISVPPFESGIVDCLVLYEQSSRGLKIADLPDTARPYWPERDLDLN